MINYININFIFNSNSSINSFVKLSFNSMKFTDNFKKMDFNVIRNSGILRFVNYYYIPNFINYYFAYFNSDLHFIKITMFIRIMHKLRIILAMATIRFIKIFIIITMIKKLHIKVLVIYD